MMHRAVLAEQINVKDTKIRFNNFLKGGLKMEMDLAIWLPGMLFLGIASFGVFFLFAKACEKI